MNVTQALVCSLLAACAAAPAMASLGGDPTSVETDRASMKGALRVTPRVDYAVHEIQAPGGTVVREYVSTDGKVFAVSWRGPGMPELGKLLGNYSAQLARAAVQPRYNHHHVHIETPDAVMQSNAYLRTFYGRAWARALFPQNFSTKDID